MNESLPARAERHHKSAVKAKVPKAAEGFCFMCEASGEKAKMSGCT